MIHLAETSRPEHLHSIRDQLASGNTVLINIQFINATFIQRGAYHITGQGPNLDKLIKQRDYNETL